MAEVASAFVSIVPTAKGFGSKLSRELSGPTRKAGAEGGKKYASGMSGSLKGAGKAIFAPLAAAAATIGVGNFLRDAISEARESQKVGALTAQVIKTTGGAAKITAGQVGDLATAISNKTGIDDEAIQSASNLLLTFTNVRNEVGKGNDVFNQATQAATDMGAALGTEPKAAAIQLGKALNDPVKGVTALSRVGVSFTKQQKDQIKTLVKSGDTLGAQKIVLGELKKEFGGAAAASATSGEKLSVAFGNFKEQIGTALLPIIDKVEKVITEKVIPAVSKFVTGIQDGTGAGGKFRDTLSGIAGFFKRNVDVIAPIVAILGSMFLAFKVITGVVKAYTAVQTILNFVLTANPIGIVIVLIAGLVAGLVIAYKRSDKFRAVVQGAFKGVQTAASFMWNKVLKPTFKFITDAFLTVAGAIINGAADAFSWVPGLGGKLRKAADKFNEFRDNVNRALNGVKDRNVKVVARGYTQVASGKFAGKQIPIELARGGPVPMVPGAVRGKDSVPIVGMPGEFMIRRDGSNLADAMKFYGYPTYAKGGPITDFPPRFNGAIDKRLTPKARARFEDLLRKQEGSGTFTRGNGTGSRASLVAFGRLIASMGYSVTEGPPPFGPVHRVHAPNSRHYSGRAIDVNHGAGTSALEQSFLRKIIPLSRTYGLDSIFMKPGHYNHAHFQYDQGGWLQPGRTMVENKTGKPEAVFNQEQLAALTSGRGGVTITGDIYNSSPRKVVRDVIQEQKRHDALNAVYSY